MKPWAFGDLQYFQGNWFFFILIGLWQVIWTGLALWHAAQRGEKKWFVLFLFVHTMGILEIVYLVFVVKFFTQEKVLQKSSKRKK